MKNWIKGLAMLAFFTGSALSGLLAQDIERNVVGSAGAYYDNVLFGSLHWTVGEMAVSRFETTLQLDEGFHQLYYDLLVEVEDLPPAWDVNVYPNPTVNWVKLDFPPDQVVDALLYTAEGQLLYQTTQVQSGSSLDLSTYPEGTYLLRLVDEWHNSYTVRILKMRL